ncbi:MULTISPECIES: WXG100 family type VII secretion target [Thermomonosporaceae]|uniref:WXG100 family type VII secretion target n=1 Tax=Thermomonosporaceae TaxID=2012 RepID=UPI00255A8208|nr:MULTISPECIES: WXG100 family type VII secretion target [Thermomonosporaceae]MDL4772858.1 WXG100 family type VII secretion target [Actinomadura xylanilytica]
MGEAFGVTYSALQKAEEMFKSKNSEMVELLDELEGDLQTTLAKWEDDARDAYFDSKKKWDAAAKEQAKAVKEFSEAIRTASENYKKAEQANSKIWA